jgi:hypothetical protein
MSDLERVLGEAQKAREEAEAAAQRAADLEAQAESARERARQEREERKRAWAQGIVDTYEADITAADAAIQAAQERFDTVAVEDLPQAAKAYLEWGNAAIRHYVLQVRVGTAAPMLNMDVSDAEFASPPPFSQALDQAFGRHLAKLSAEARETTAAEIGRTLDDEDPTLATTSPGDAQA